MTRLHCATATSAILSVLLLGSVSGAKAQSFADPIVDPFAVLAGQSISNTGPTTIDGNVGLSPNPHASITGFPPGTVSGTIYAADDNTIAANAKAALTTLYNNLSGQAVTADLTGQNLGNRVLTPGVYKFAGPADLTGTLTLDGLNGNDPFIFLINSTLITASSSTIALIHGALGSNVFFVVGSSATLGTGTTFSGKILAVASITLNTGATINCGAALARVGSVTLDTNVFSNVCAQIDDTFAAVLGQYGTAGQQAIAAAIDAFVAANGIGALSPEFQALLAGLSPTELAAALGRLSGESSTGVSSAATQSMDSFLSSLFDSTFGADNSGPGTPAPENGRGPRTVKTLGYADEAGAETAAATAASFNRPMPAVDSGRWSVWASGYGSQSNTDGDALAGTHDRSTSAIGLAAGYGRQVSARTTVGLALGVGGTRFGLSDGLGGGTSQTLEAALYTRTSSEHAYIATALAYAYNAVSTSRNVVLGPPVVINDVYTASYSGHDVAGEIEAGYRVGWLSPYAAVRAGAFFAPAYRESGPGAFGLSYAASTTWSLRTELGARVARTIALHDGMALTLKGRAAWAHDFGSSPVVTASFTALPGYTFGVMGAAPTRDWLLLSVGTELGFGNGFAVGGSVDTALAANTQTYSGNARVSYRW